MKPSMKNERRVYGLEGLGVTSNIFQGDHPKYKASFLYLPRTLKPFGLKSWQNPLNIKIQEGWIQDSTKVLLRFIGLPLHIGIVVKSWSQSENWLQILWLNYAALFSKPFPTRIQTYLICSDTDSLFLIHAAPDKRNNLWQNKCVWNYGRNKKNLHGKQEKKPFKRELW